MIAATYGQGEGVDGNGIVAGHAYSLISFHDVLDGGNPVSLIKLRNPWGRGEWMGDWSDKSQKWTPELKAQLNVKDANDGLFFMNISDYKEIFRETSICMTIDPEYKHSTSYATTAKTDTVFFKFTLTKRLDTSKKCFGI